MSPVIIEVNAPVERVFQFMSDFENAPKLITGITRVEMITPGPVGVGTSFKETRMMMKREATETMTVTAFDPPRSYTLSAHSCGVDFASRFDFAAKGDKTLVTVDFQMKPKTLFAKIVGPVCGLLMGGMMKKCVMKDMTDMKHAAEAVPTA